MCRLLFRFSLGRLFLGSLFRLGLGWGVALGLGCSCQGRGGGDVWLVIFIIQAGNRWLILSGRLLGRSHGGCGGGRNLLVRGSLVELLPFCLFVVLLAEAVLQAGQTAGERGAQLVLVLWLFILVLVGFGYGLAGFAEDLGAKGIGEERLDVGCVVGFKDEVQEVRGAGDVGNQIGLVGVGDAQIQDLDVGGALAHGNFTGAGCKLRGILARCHHDAHGSVQHLVNAAEYQVTFS